MSEGAEGGSDCGESRGFESGFGLGKVGLFCYRPQNVECWLLSGSGRATCSALDAASCAILFIDVLRCSGTSVVAWMLMLCRFVSSLLDRLAGSWCRLGCGPCFTLCAWLILFSQVVRLAQPAGAIIGHRWRRGHRIYRFLVRRTTLTRCRRYILQHLKVGRSNPNKR